MFDVLTWEGSVKKNTRVGVDVVNNLPDVDDGVPFPPPFQTTVLVLLVVPSNLACADGFRWIFCWCSFSALIQVFELVLE